jgi:hypothetical protein
MEYVNTSYFGDDRQTDDGQTDPLDASGGPPVFSLLSLMCILAMTKIDDKLGYLAGRCSLGNEYKAPGMPLRGQYKCALCRKQLHSAILGCGISYEETKVTCPDPLFRAML